MKKPYFYSSLTLLIMLFSGPAFSQPAVGSQSCAVCHKSIFNEWRSSKHAKANSLVPSGHPKEKSCKVCHDPDLFRSKLPKAGGVSCEHCHGNGGFYQHEFIMKDKEAAKLSGMKEPKKTCLKCHATKPFHLRPKGLKDLFEKLKVHSFGPKKNKKKNNKEEEAKK